MLMKIALAVVLILFLLFIVGQIWTMSGKTRIVETGLTKVAKELEKARSDSHQLHMDFNFYSNPINLEKELRARFNYSLPGEKLIILVPPKTTTTQP